MTPEDEVTLAFGICEYESVLTSFDALRRQGVDVPYSISGRVQREQQELVQRWLFEHGEAVQRDPSDVAAELRVWFLDHLDELLDQLREDGDDGEDQHTGAVEPSGPDPEV